MKKTNYIIFSLIIILILMFNCTIVFDRWALEFDDVDVGGEPDTLTIFNETGETIDSVKYYVGNRPPSDWDSAGGVKTLSSYISNNDDKEYTIGNASSDDIEADDGDTVWIRVAAENAWNSSKLFATDAFVFEAAAADAWEVQVFKE